VRYQDKPWLKSYKLGPYRLEESLAPFPEQPVFRALELAAEKYPTQTAILFRGRAIKYHTLNGLVNRMAAALAEMDVRRGDRVCLFLPNCMEFMIADWAIMKAGAAVVPTSILRSEEGLIHELARSGSKVVFCQESGLGKVLRVGDRCAYEHVIVTSDAGYDAAGVAAELPDGVHEFRQLLERYDPIPPVVEIDPKKDLCELAFTGGATGVPKGVMITHYNRYSCILQGFPWVMKPMMRGFAGKASVLVSVPLFHSYGHYTHQSAAYLGLRVILLPDPRATEEIVATIKEYRPFLIASVPTQLMRVIGADIGRLNVIPLSGAAPLPKEVADRIKREIGNSVSEAYGLTETAPLTHFNLSGFSRITGFMPQEKPGIGIPTPDTECKLVDPETGEEVPFGERGELLVRGPQVMLGYWPDPGAGLSDDGWLQTGDVAEMDEDGYFTVVDRTKDMVNVSGMKVYTNVVDEVLYRHPAVLMAAAFGVPDPEIPGSERVMAVIQLREGSAGEVTAEEIQEFCKAHLSPYAVPKFIEFRESLPLTVTEKVFKRALREEMLASMTKRRQDSGSDPHA
jgi:long-chain acyl-CoA synthetase